MYTFDSRIRYSETDENAVLTIESLINYFQDCSTFQTEDYGAGLTWLTEQKLAWVLNYWQIDIFRLPSLYEHVRIGTVPYSLKGFIGLRNFFMDASPASPVSPGKEPEQAERLAIANSVWSLMDMEKMMPSRVTPEHAAHYPLEDKLPMEYLDRKIRLPEKSLVLEAKPVTVHHSHLDTNLHVNNGQYVRIALSALVQIWGEISDDLRSAYSVEQTTTRQVRLRAEYKKQAHLDDVLRRVVHVTGDTPENSTVYIDLLLDGESCCVVSLSRLPEAGEES